MSDRSLGPWTRKTLAATIDHTLLRPDASAEAVRRLCAEARTYGFASVCVAPCRVSLAVSCLGGPEGGMVGTVVGFPLGFQDAVVKAAEARRARDLGAREIDMVLNVGWLKEGSHAAVEDEIRAVVTAVRGVPVKVILETCLLTDEEKRTACALAERGGGPVRQDLHGIRRGGRHGGRRAPPAPRRGKPPGGQGLGGHSYSGGGFGPPRRRGGPPGVFRPCGPGGGPGGALIP